MAIARRETTFLVAPWLFGALAILRTGHGARLAGRAPLLSSGPARSSG